MSVSENVCLYVSLCTCMYVSAVTVRMSFCVFGCLFGCVVVNLCVLVCVRGFVCPCVRVGLFVVCVCFALVG